MPTPTREDLEALDLLFPPPAPGTPTAREADFARQLCRNVGAELLAVCPPCPHRDAAVQALVQACRHAQAAVRGDTMDALRELMEGPDADFEVLPLPGEVDA